MGLFFIVRKESVVVFSKFLRFCILSFLYIYFWNLNKIWLFYENYWLFWFDYVVGELSSYIMYDCIWFINLYDDVII